MATTSREPLPVRPEWNHHALEAVLSFDEVAQHLGCDKRTVQRLVDDGRLVAVYLLNRRRVVRQRDLQRFIDSLSEDAIDA